MVPDFDLSTIKLVLGSLSFFSSLDQMSVMSFLYYYAKINRTWVWCNDRSSKGEVVPSCDHHPGTHGTVSYDAVLSFQGRDVPKDALYGSWFGAWEYSSC